MQLRPLGRSVRRRAAGGDANQDMGIPILPKPYVRTSTRRAAAGARAGAAAHRAAAGERVEPGQPAAGARGGRRAAGRGRVRAARGHRAAGAALVGITLEPYYQTRK